VISIDCETTGGDHYHGSRPFFVTSSDGDATTCWDWAVDPKDRRPVVPRDHLDDVLELCRRRPVVLQNGKFDVTAVSLLMRDHGIPFEWDWDGVHDTLTAGHVLSSNTRHDLTSMVAQYLGVNIEPHEVALRRTCIEARRYVAKKSRPQFADWQTAREGMPGLPSARGTGKGEKDRLWKNDMWLPRAVAVQEQWTKPDPDCDHVWNEDRCLECGGHFWHIALREYSNADSESTVALWPVMEHRLRHRGLWNIYLAQLPLIAITLDMEWQGATLNGKEVVRMRQAYTEEAACLSGQCRDIAAEYQEEDLFGRLAPYDLKLPKGAAVNGSLHHFMFEMLQLPAEVHTAGGREAINKEAYQNWNLTLDPGSKELAFVRLLQRRTKMEKAVTALDGYESFMLPTDDDDWYVIHGNANLTGSATLRFSFSAPNLQNVSNQELVCEECNGDGCDTCGGTGKELQSVRHCFGPAPGREWWSLDYKNVELRIPAYESGETDLIALFEKADEPPFYGSQHLLNCSLVYPDLWAAVLDEVGFAAVGPEFKKRYKHTWYHYGKCGGLAMQYQAGEYTADHTFRRRGSYRQIKQSLARLEKHNQWCIRFAERHGYIETIPNRYVDPKHGYPLLCTRTENGRILPTVPLSYRTQGTAMDITRTAMRKCAGELREWRRADGFDGRMCLQVHDELVFDFPRAAHPLRNRKASNYVRVVELKRLMESCGDDVGVPTPVGVSYHDTSWAREEILV
jgi:DNA polymerase I-like protein with 3'-5' exonuclease and polymerase domains